MAKKKTKKMSTRKAVILLVACYVIFHVLYGFTSIVDLKMQQNQLAQELDTAYAEQAELQSQLEYMSSEDAIEEIAREKLGLVKNGEILIRHVDTSQTQ